MVRHPGAETRGKDELYGVRTDLSFSHNKVRMREM